MLVVQLSEQRETFLVARKCMIDFFSLCFYFFLFFSPFSFVHILCMLYPFEHVPNSSSTNHLSHLICFYILYPFSFPNFYVLIRTYLPLSFVYFSLCLSVSLLSCVYFKHVCWWHLITATGEPWQLDHIDIESLKWSPLLPSEVSLIFNNLAKNKDN